MNIRLSSSKRDHGVKELLSSDLSEYWATDDSLPHGIQFTFCRLTYVEEVRIFLSHSQDDSYTPREIEVLCGLTESTIDSIILTSLLEPEGYIVFNVNKKCFFLQIIILSNHQEGKDSHIRNIKIMESKTKEMYLKVEQ